MTDLTAFLRGIRSKPDDVIRRLAFADWLDEHGDPAWAEFVRLQCEIEPVRGRYDLPGVFANEKRERELLRANEKRWLAPGDGLPAGDSPLVPRFGFRRGVVEVVRMSVADWLAHGEAVLAAFPTVRELVVFHARGECRDLARSDQLRHLDGLEIADWITPDDAGELCRVAWDELRTLRMWCGGDDSPEQHVLAGFTHATFPTLSVWEFVVLTPGAGIDDQFLSDIGFILENRISARVVRPAEQLFPLGSSSGDGDIGYGIYAGRLRGSTQALVVDPGNANSDRVEVFTYRKYGRFLRSSDKALPPKRDGEWWDDRMRKALRFKPGTIAVREFRVPERHFGVQLFDEMDHTLLVNPDLPDGPVRREALERLVWWLARGNFVIRNGQNYWADRDGDIHSS